ncbi:MAG TPA: hypothetical protein VFI11_07945 [Anaerolineales bacterium]|nr:hypothetical protein [Anaerolineales bacterium]
MSRVIRIQAAHRTRQHILQAMALAVRAAASPETDPQVERDILAFLDACLAELSKSVDETASAWEKRGYWLKADRFRQEWSWVERSSASLNQALGRRDLERSRACGMELATHLQHVRLPASRLQARPWAGAWKKRNGSTRNPSPT